MNQIVFFVPGKCAQQGSKRHVGAGRMVESNPKLKPWRSLVSLCAKEEMGNQPPTLTPAKVEVQFFFERPKSHYGTGKNALNLKPNAPRLMSSAPDVDKLLRAVLDSLTGICFADDRLVAEITGAKYYGVPGARITVSEAVDHGA